MGNIEQENTKADKFNGFLAGLITNVTNIKAILFFVTVFSVVIGTGNNLSLLFYGAYILSYIVIVYLCINTYFRIYHKNNKFIKAWITFTCVDNIIGYF